MGLNLRPNRMLGKQTCFLYAVINVARLNDCITVCNWCPFSRFEMLLLLQTLLAMLSQLPLLPLLLLTVLPLNITTMPFINLMMPKHISEFHIHLIVSLRISWLHDLPANSCRKHTHSRKYCSSYTPLMHMGHSFSLCC